MRFLIKTILLWLTFSSLTSCDKSEEQEFSYDETYCADSWVCVQNTLNLPDPEACLEEFLESEEITFSNLSYNLENEPETCEACSCLSGYVFRITASDEFEEELLNLGFEIE